MKKIVLAAVAALTLLAGAAPSFAGNTNGSIESQSANIQAGGGAPGVVLPFQGR
jgi:hypothetical protein